MITALFLKGMQLEEIKKTFSEFNLSYKYRTQKRKIRINKGKILKILEKLRKN